MTQASRASRAVPAGDQEERYIQAISRPSVVDAYSRWSELSYAENYLLSVYVGDGCPDVVDLGCGTGRMLASAGSSFGSYIGIDTSERMVAAALQSYPEHDFRIADITDPILDEASADLVLLMHNVVDMLYPRDRREAVLREASRLLRPRGVVIVSSHMVPRDAATGYYDEDYHGVTVSTFRTSFSSWVREVEEAGFDVEVAMRDRRDTIADWAYIAGRLRAE